MTKKCICENLQPNKEEILVHGFWTTIYIKLEDGEYKLIAEGEGVASLTLLWCPLCGRVLGKI